MSAGQVATRFGTFLPDIHSFDPTAFGLSAAEATVMVSKAFKTSLINLGNTSDFCTSIDNCVANHLQSGACGCFHQESIAVGCCCVSMSQKCLTVPAVMTGLAHITARSAALL
jgi:hypothetical protein